MRPRKLTPPQPQRKAGGVEISLDANELEGLSEADLRAKYEQAGRKAGTHEDFSDFVGKEVAKRRKTGEYSRGFGVEEKRS